MKPRILLALLVVVLAIPLTGCPKKSADGEVGVEKAEGSSSSDKSGEGATDEMQEKKGGSSEATSAEPAAGEADKK